jgi:dCMP deaminase
VERISRDKLLMDVALLFKRRSTCLRRQVGAVLAREGRILSTGYGGAPAGVPHCSEETCGPDKPCIRTIHAEANAVAYAARTGVATDSTTLYCTASPCIECAKLIINAGIVRVVYDEEYRDTGPIILLRSVGIRCEKHGPSPVAPTAAELDTELGDF